MSRRTHRKHDTAPLSLYNRHTITFRYDENCGQKTPEKRRSDQAVLVQEGGGVEAPAHERSGASLKSWPLRMGAQGPH